MVDVEILGDDVRTDGRTARARSSCQSSDATGSCMSSVDTLLRQVHQTLLDRTRLNPQDSVAHRDLADLERAVVAAPAPVHKRTTCSSRASTADGRPAWHPADPGYGIQEHVRGPSMGIRR